MPVRALQHLGMKETRVTATVCVIGAGIAGLLAAVRLARDSSRRVVVVESGLRHLDTAIARLNEIDNPSANYAGATELRFRGLGGNSILWAGKLIPLSAHDTRARPYLNLPAWPFDPAELEQYRPELEALLGVDSESHEEDVSAKLDPDKLLPRDDADFVLRWPKRPTIKNHNLAYIFRQELESLPNLELWLGATVAGFAFDPGTGRLNEISAINQNGQTLRVAAKEFLIAAGTLETTRLLLLADQQANNFISRKTDALGRYFNDHLGFEIATLRPLDRTRTNRALSDRSTLGALRHLHFELRPEIQEQEQIGSAYFDIGAELPPTSALTKAKEFVQKARRAHPAALGDLADVLRDAPSLFWTAQWQYMRKQKYWPPNANLRIKIWTEQLPHQRNRICLSSTPDPLGLPKLRLEWTKTDAEEKTFRVMGEKIERYWKSGLAHICELDWHAAAKNPAARITDLTQDLAHPAGSTRMGTDPASSVVDPALRVHLVPNLSVASASVFPSSGSANPTFTIMQLAYRATDAIVRRL